MRQIGKGVNALALCSKWPEFTSTFAVQCIIAVRQKFVTTHDEIDTFDGSSSSDSGTFDEIALQ